MTKRKLKKELKIVEENLLIAIKESRELKKELKAERASFSSLMDAYEIKSDEKKATVINAKELGVELAERNGLLTKILSLIKTVPHLESLSNQRAE